MIFQENTKFHSVAGSEKYYPELNKFFKRAYF